MKARGGMTWRWMRLCVLGLLIGGSTACDGDGPVGPRFSGVETAIVLNSIDLSLTAFPVDSPADRRSIGLAQTGSPVSMATRNGIAVVPMGFLATTVVVDLVRDSLWSVPLPSGSGATGAAFLNDSIVYVANPNLNTVNPVDIRAASAGSPIPVGVFPQAVAVVGGRVFVANAELDENFQPARPGRISVIDPAGNSVVATIELTGLNPSAMIAGPDGLLYVINSGAFGSGNGSLSVVDPGTFQEIEHHTGFGEFPGDIVVDRSRRVYVSAFSFGVAVWDAAGDSFIAPPADPLVLNGSTVSSGLGLDSEERLYSLVPGDCIAPGQLVRTGPNVATATAESFGAGVCPIDVGFTRVESP